jgi:FtsP/CotA-like multicopper oxidase with cupredoxin domain
MRSIRIRLLTMIRCLPPVPLLLGPFNHDLSDLTPEAFNSCTPTQGLTEVVSVDAKDGWASINLISSAAINTLEVSIDDHKLYVYAADGRYIIPQVVDAVLVPNGNRYTAFVKLDQPPADYTIRVATAGLNQVSTGYATLSYAGSTGPATPNPVINYAGQNITADFVPFLDAAIVPFKAIDVSDVAIAQTFLLSIENFGASYIWTLSGLEPYSQNLELDEPLLFNPDSAVGQNTNITISTVNGTWVDLVIQSVGPISPPHPIHKHSNKGFIIGQGTGAWNWTTVAEAQAVIPQNFNYVNPPLRDGFTTPPANGSPTWMAVRYQVVNPGAFILHCHIQTHFSGGMAIAILDGIDKWPVVPEEYLTANFPEY